MSSPNNSSPWKLEWSDDLSVSIPEIDAEHQHFIQLVNALNEAIVARMEVRAIQQRMQAILEDATAHFAHEETLFKEWNYPDAEQHAQRHAEVLQALHEIMHGFDKNGLDYEWIEAGLQVKQALIEHMLAEDMKYRDYCRTLGK
ncbi:MAG: hemerythrin domain-containing protein [Sideroxydans sp.]|nr:hemerythrin domain-containing protein [Sideroxydans sp.]